jgi:hypothetical protein
MASKESTSTDSWTVSFLLKEKQKRNGLPNDFPVRVVTGAGYKYAKHGSDR